MSDSFHVEPEELTSHAGAVDRTGNAVALAANAAQQVVLGQGSFGLLFAGLGLELNALGLLGGVVAGESANKLHHLGENLRGAAADYVTVDTEHKGVFDGIASAVQY